LIDKDKNGELDFEEMVEFYVGEPAKIEIEGHRGPVPEKVKVKPEPKFIFSDKLTTEQQVKKDRILLL